MRRFKLIKHSHVHITSINHLKPYNVPVEGLSQAELDTG